MNKPVYKSSVGKYMGAFLQQLRDLGLKAVDVEHRLKTIDRYLVESGFTGSYITEEVYLGWWASTEGQCGTTRYAKAATFIRFLKYMASIGTDCHVPRLPKKATADHIPYTYSENDMAEIFKACDRLRIKARYTHSIMICIPALIRLLYSTALRISEAIDIRIGNIDFTHHLIKLEYTKNGHQRYAPINASLEAVLRQYMSYRNRLPYPELLHPDSHLFVSSQGRKITPGTALKYMHQIIVEAGLEFKGEKEGPHLHSLRHSACIHSMVKCAKADMDLYCSLPILSVFMGHRHVLDTEHYIRLTQEMYPDLIKLDQSVTASINGIVRRANLIYDENKEITD